MANSYYTFISGATGGIGKAFAVLFAKNGNNLFLTGRSQKKLDALKLELLNINQNISIFTFPCEMTSDGSRLEMFDYIVDNSLIFDNIINVAGVDIQKGFLNYTYNKVLFQIRVNVEATISLTYLLLGRAIENVKIITISSMSSVTPMPYFALYSATKECLTWFYTALRLEIKESGAKITTVLPGGVYTRQDIIEDIKGQGLWGKLSSKSPEWVAKKSLKAVNKNKSVYIPGGFNKFLYFVMKILPKSITMRFIKNRWKKQEKDAF